ncbi:MAG: YciI family protein [Pseudorhodoplanes sp.]
MFIAMLTAVPDPSGLREKTRAEHDRYWEPHLKVLRFAGATLSDDGQTRLGQVIILDVDDRKTAEAIATNDPFVKVGLFSDCVVRKFRVSVPWQEG